MDPLENLIRANPALSATIGLIVAIGLAAFVYLLFGRSDSRRFSIVVLIAARRGAGYAAARK